MTKILMLKVARNPSGTPTKGRVNKTKAAKAIKNEPTPWSVAMWAVELRV